jgi:uncharacterized protein involved in exopolysaccharide biosynthesis
MVSMAPREPVAEEVVDFRALGRRLMARRRLVAAIVAVSTTAFAAAAFIMTPVYRATAILAPASHQSSGRGLLNSALGDLGGVAALAGLNISTIDPGTEEALAVLQSRELTEAFVKDWNLMPKLFPGRWDMATNSWKASWWRKTPTLAKGFDYFDRHVRTVTADKKTGLVTLHIVWKDRDEAAAWATELVRRVNDEMRARAIAEADASMAYLDKESQSAQTVTARDAVSRLMETEIRQRMVANVSREYAFRVVDAALPPDKDDPLRPQKAVLTIAGLLIGVLIALAVVAWSGDPGARARQGAPQGGTRA